MHTVNAYIQVRPGSWQRTRPRYEIGDHYISFTIEPTASKREQKNDHLQLTLGPARNRSKSDKSWQDTEERALHDQLTDILTEVLVSAEVAYRDGQVRHREWMISRKTEAQAEIKRRAEEAESKAREMAERRAQERVDLLLSQAKAFDQANRIRAFIEEALSRAGDGPISESELQQWAAWARQEADRIDPTVGVSLQQAIRQHSNLP